MFIFDKLSNIYFSTKINDSHISSGFWTRALGDGRKKENIIRYFKNQKISFDKIIVPEQVHNDKVYNTKSSIPCFFTSSPLQGAPGDLPAGRQGCKKTDIFAFTKSLTSKTFFPSLKTDGVITSLNNVILTVISADCVPIIFADRKNKLIGISHQGWKGSFKRLAQKMVKKMLDFGSKFENIIAAIGPAIGDCCYDISQDRYELLKKEFPDYKDQIFRINNNTIYLNLSLLNYLQLIDAGIKKENIDFFPFCTSCNSEKFFSYRRAQNKKDFERMLSFVVLR